MPSSAARVHRGVLLTVLYGGATFAHAQELRSIQSINQSYLTCVQSAFEPRGRNAEETQRFNARAGPLRDTPGALRWHKAGEARPHVRHETTRVHHAARRRGGVATRGRAQRAGAPRHALKVRPSYLKLRGT